jgi:hypothetical protein
VVHRNTSDSLGRRQLATSSARVLETPIGGSSDGTPWDYADNVGSGPAEAPSYGRFRAGAWDALRLLWDRSTLERVQKCRRVSLGPLIGLERDGDRARYTGLTTCGSPWACPLCSAKIAAGRADELTQAVERWHELGNTVALLTLTMRHQAGVSLASYWDALSPAMAASVGGRYRRARAAKVAAGVEGYVASREATHGTNGWHLHTHTLLFISGEPDEGTVRELGEAIHAAWSARLVKEGLDAPSHRHGTDLRVLDLSQSRAEAACYLAKGVYESSRAAAEITGAQGKDARRGNRTPWAILADLVHHGRARDLMLWREWEATTHNRRAISWSVGMRDRLGLKEEQTDEDLATEQPNPPQLVVTLSKDQWALVRRRPRGPTELLDAAEAAQSLLEAQLICERLLRAWQALPRAGP